MKFLLSSFNENLTSKTPLACFISFVSPHENIFIIFKLFYNQNK